MIVFAAIAPHGDIAIEEATPDDQRGLGGATRAAMVELAGRFDAAAPEATVLFTPHNAHVEGHFAVVVAAAVKGGLGDFLPGGAAPLELECPVDRELAHSVLAGLRAAEGWEPELLSYEAPTYYGMLCAAFSTDSI